MLSFSLWKRTYLVNTNLLHIRSFDDVARHKAYERTDLQYQGSNVVFERVDCHEQVEAQASGCLNESSYI